MYSSTAPHPRRYTIVWRTSAALALTLILLLLLAQRLPARSNGIVLIDLSAQCIAGQPEIYIEWETAREFDTVGFFLSRSLSATTVYTRVSAFIPSEGDTSTGAQYAFVDVTTELSRTYYYRLEVVNTDQSLTLYGPISITAGADSGSMLIFPRVYLPLMMHMN